MEGWSDLAVINDVDASITKAHRAILARSPFFRGDSNKIHIKVDPVGWRVARDFIYWYHQAGAIDDPIDLFINRIDHPAFTPNELASGVDVLDRLGFGSFAMALAPYVDLALATLEELNTLTRIPALRRQVVAAAMVGHDMSRLPDGAFPDLEDEISSMLFLEHGSWRKRLLELRDQAFALDLPWDEATAVFGTLLPPLQDRYIQRALTTEAFHHPGVVAIITWTVHHRALDRVPRNHRIAWILACRRDPREVIKELFDHRHESWDNRHITYAMGMVILRSKNQIPPTIVALIVRRLKEIELPSFRALAMALSPGRDID